MLIDQDGRILLGARRVMPNVGKLNLPGGFVGPDETFEEAIERELYEELGLKAKDYGSLMYAGGRRDAHTQEGTTRNLLSIIMTTKLQHRDFVPNDEVTKYVWKLPAELNASN